MFAVYKEVKHYLHHIKYLLKIFLAFAAYDIRASWILNTVIFQYYSTSNVSGGEKISRFIEMTLAKPELANQQVLCLDNNATFILKTCWQENWSPVQKSQLQDLHHQF